MIKLNFVTDRGSIDNVIWSFIMPACDPAQKDVMVDRLFEFINANFNEPSLVEYISQKGVIFIDPYSHLNQARMLARCTDGDAHRGRINLYPIAQFITYYTIARLCGWSIYCVPYTPDRIFEPSRYITIADELIEYFGEPTITNKTAFDTLNFIRYAKPPNDYPLDNTYPKAVGIFK